MAYLAYDQILGVFIGKNNACLEGGCVVEYHQDGKGESRNHATGLAGRECSEDRHSRATSSRSRECDSALTPGDGGACS